MEELVSIIIPTFNRGHLIERAVKSVLGQTYQNIEVIVVDDGSTDNTEYVMEQLKSESVRYIREKKNSGACHARNLGINLSLGTFVSFLDSDDYWEKNKIQEEILFLKKYDADIVVCNYWVERDGVKKKK